jgi:hypothetical protein
VVVALVDIAATAAMVVLTLVAAAAVVEVAVAVLGSTLPDHILLLVAGAEEVLGFTAKVQAVAVDRLLAE